MKTSIRSCTGAALLSLAIGSSDAGQAGAASGQATLDLLASVRIGTPTEARTTTTSHDAFHVPEAPFAAWAPEDQAAVPRRVAAFCATLWTMAHDAPGTRFLPAAQPPSDEQQLGADLCIAAHLPADWPPRPAMVRALNDIIARARALGSTLQLPVQLKQ